MIVFLAVLGILAWLAERYSVAHVMDGLESETVLSKAVVEPGEEFVWTLTIKNRKRLMVPYLKVKEQVPEGLRVFKTEEAVASKDALGLSSVLYLAGRQRMELARTVFLPARGRYFFRGVSAEAGDFLGLRLVSESWPELKEIVVKPSPASWEPLPELLGGYLGEYAGKKSLFEDPVLIRGFREYTGHESLRSISWTQSARLGRFLVKENESVAELSCSILLDVECKSGEGTAALLEQCFSLVRSLCEELEARRISYDFQTNGVIAGAMGNWNRVGDGLGAGHLETVLEGLGRMTYDCREESGVFLSRILKGLQAGRSLLYVAPDRKEAAVPYLSGLEERSGRKVLAIYGEDV